MTTFTHDVVVVGAGAAGLTVAGGLARLGLRVALVERDRLGGECLHTGCVPSKALLAAAARAQAVRDAPRFGIHAGEPHVDWRGVRAHVEGAIAAIAPHDAPGRFRAWGVEVIQGEARLVDRHGVEVGARRLAAPRIVLATGSRPAVPAIPGLAALPFLTNETVFALDALPERLVVLGAGPVGCELAQAFRRLGARVALLDAGRCLAASDRDAAVIVVARLRAEGVEIIERAAVTVAEPCAAGLRLRLADGAAIEGSHLLLATGREARTDGLGLAEAGVTVGRDGILVDRHGRTNLRSIYAIGDCRAGPRFTHAAGHEGERLVMALGFGLPAPIDHAALPRVAYTDPELAEAGMSEAAARAAGGRVEVLRQDFCDNDRAVCEGDTAGFCRIVRRGGRVVGVTIVGAGAGELLAPFLPLIARRRATLWAMAGTVLPYPTRGETPKATAFSAFEPRVFSSPARFAARMVARLRAAMC